MENEEHLDTRSEAVRDYLQRPPSNIIRWGSGIISAVIIGAIFVTWVIKYPIVIQSQFSLTTQLEPKPVVSRDDGRLLQLLVSNNQKVSQDQLLGVLESSADYREIFQLEIELDSMQSLFEREEYERLDVTHIKSYHHLGEVQIAYQDFRQQLVDLCTAIGKGHYHKKITLLQMDISDLKAANAVLDSQHSLYKRDLFLAQSEFKLNQNLYDSKVITQLDLNREESKMIAKKLQLKTTESAVLNNAAQIRDKQDEIMDIDAHASQQLEDYQQSVNSLNSAIASWKTRHVLKSPCPGEIVFADNLQEKQDVKAGEELFLIFEDATGYMGKLSIPQENSGKVKVGQEVLIKFHGYPYEEFGIVEGKILSSPKLFTQNRELFFALVELPRGLQTSHHKLLKPKYGMTATAEIITEDLRLLERIFYSVRKIFS